MGLYVEIYSLEYLYFTLPFFVCSQLQNCSYVFYIYTPLYSFIRTILILFQPILEQYLYYRYAKTLVFQYSVLTILQNMILVWDIRYRLQRYLVILTANLEDQRVCEDGIQWFGNRILVAMQYKWKSTASWNLKRSLSVG